MREFSVAVDPERLRWWSSSSFLFSFFSFFLFLQRQRGIGNVSCELTSQRGRAPRLLALPDEISLHVPFLSSLGISTRNLFRPREKTKANNLVSRRDELNRWSWMWPRVVKEGLRTNGKKRRQGRERGRGKTRKAASRFPRTYRFPRRYNNRWCLTLPRRAKPSFLSLACSRHATAHLVLLSSNGTLTFAELLPRSHGTTILPRCSILTSILPPPLSVTKLFSLSLSLFSLSQSRFHFVARPRQRRPRASPSQDRGSDRQQAYLYSWLGKLSSDSISSPLQRNSDTAVD